MEKMYFESVIQFYFYIYLFLSHCEIFSENTIGALGCGLVDIHIIHIVLYTLENLQFNRITELYVYISFPFFLFTWYLYTIKYLYIIEILDKILTVLLYIC